MSDAARVRAGTARGVALRYNAPRPAQKTPRFPATPWGRLRGERGWSLRELAQRSGVNIGALSRIEHGFGPTPDHAVALLDAYDWIDAKGTGR